MQENSNFCILRNFKISSEIVPDKDKKDMQLHQSQIANQSDIFDDPDIMEMLESACLSFKHLNSISVTSIKINSFGGFLAKLLSQNQQLESLELVNCCSEQLLLNEAFFDQS